MVTGVMQRRTISERRACNVLQLNRTVKRYHPIPTDNDAQLRAKIIDLASQYGRYGYRRITALLKAEGWKINHKRVEKIWREEGLRVPKQQKRRRHYLHNGSCKRLKALYPNHIWSYDCVVARLSNNKPFKCLTIMDEFTRESLCIRVERNIRSQDVLEVLSTLFYERGCPKYIRSDNGSEFIAHKLQAFLKEVGVQTAYITPGSPWENGFIERFNGTLRDEVLNREYFSSLQEVQIVVEVWRQQYNEVRPHSALNYKAPKTFMSLYKTLPSELVQQMGA